MKLAVGARNREGKAILIHGMQRQGDASDQPKRCGLTDGKLEPDKG